MPPKIDNTTYVALIGLASYGGDAEASGDGNVFVLHLRSVSLGRSAICMEDVQAVDPQGGSLPFDAVSGAVEVFSHKRIYLPLARK